MFFISALFAIAAAVWMIPVVMSGRALIFSLIILVTGTVIGPLFLAIDGPFLISIDRVLWVMMFGLLMVWFASW